jgi:hypothetical protein
VKAPEDAVFDVAMKTLPVLQWLAIAVWPLLSGCATQKLWDAKAYREPWSPPNLHLAFDEQRKDVLVRYDEGNDRSKHPTPRAYFLFQNLKRNESRRKPAFVDASRATALKPVEIFAPEQMPENAAALELYAVAARGAPNFKLLSRGHELGEFSLPVYKDGIWQTQKAMLMPLAVGADATVVGGFLGLLWLYASAPGLCDE